MSTMSDEFERETTRYMRRIEGTNPSWDQLAAHALWVLASVRQVYGDDAVSVALAGAVRVLDAHPELVEGAA